MSTVKNARAIWNCECKPHTHHKRMHSYAYDASEQWIAAEPQAAACSTKRDCSDDVRAWGIILRRITGADALHTLAVFVNHRVGRQTRGRFSHSAYSFQRVWSFFCVTQMFTTQNCSNYFTFRTRGNRLETYIRPYKCTSNALMSWLCNIIVLHMIFISNVNVITHFAITYT